MRTSWWLMLSLCLLACSSSKSPTPTNGRDAPDGGMAGANDPSAGASSDSPTGPAGTSGSGDGPSSEGGSSGSGPSNEGGASASGSSSDDGGSAGGPSNEGGSSGSGYGGSPANGANGANAGQGGTGEGQPVGETPASQIPGIPLNELGAVVVIKRFATTAGGSSYFWADLDLNVTRVDDPSEHWTVTTTGKEPGLAPAVRVRPGVAYRVEASGGSIQLWAGTKFVASTFDPPSTSNVVNLAENQVLGIANYLSTDVFLGDTWAPGVYGGDRWYCDYSQQGCYCNWTQGSTLSWTECPPIQYTCCLKAAVGGDCDCPAGSSSFECTLASNAGLEVPSCPIGNVPPGTAPANPAECTSVEDAGIAVAASVEQDTNPPSPTGGVIETGVYHLSAKTTYLPLGCTGAPSTASSATYAFTATSANGGTFAAATAAAEYAGEYSTAGSSITLQITCPAAASPVTLSYSAAPQEVQMFQASGCRTEENVLTAE